MLAREPLLAVGRDLGLDATSDPSHVVSKSLLSDSLGDELLTPSPSS